MFLILPTGMEDPNYPLKEFSAVNAVKQLEDERTEFVDWGVGSFLENAARKGYVYEPPVLDGPSGAYVRHAGRNMVNFAGCSFLGMHTRADIGFHFASAAAKYGLATGGSRMVQGASRPHADLEAELCRATGKEQALSFASGMLANVGFVHALSRSVKLGKDCEIDLSDTVFVLDRDSHWSLWKSVEGLKFGERLFLFRHNDPGSLEKTLAKLTGKRVVVIFESVYSADGSIAPVGDIMDVCEKYGALSFVDDANGFFVYGEPQRPFYEEFQQLRRATFHMVSFSKAVGLEGGAIAGPKEFIQAFEGLAGTSAFTATMLPPAASAASLVMRTLREQPDIVDGFLARCADFRTALLEVGCALSPTPSYITSVLIGADDKAEAVRRDFAEAGYLVPIFRYPAVKRGHAGIRLMLSLDHTEDDISGFVSTLQRLKKHHDF